MPNAAYRDQLLQILDKYIAGTASPEEIAFVDGYFLHFDANKEENIHLTVEEKARIEGMLLQKIDTRIADMERFPNGRRKPIFRIMWKFAAAAAIIGCLIGGAYLYKHQTPEQSQPIAIHDLAPGSTGALLSFEGKRPSILLDTARNGRIGIGVTKSAAGIRVLHDDTLPGAANEIVYATLSTPNARTQALQLPDGSMVWLNAASSIRFPTKFPGKERVVEITGEVDLQIAPDKNRPFKVLSGSQQWEVLGTEFNINAYSNEPVIRTTLLEGSLRTHNTILKPGQQSVVQRADDQMHLVDNVNTADAVAWKNGSFVFNDHTDLQTVMRAVARWYDAEVEYRGPVPVAELGGKIPRNSTASEVLKILTYSTNAKFTIEGKKIIVTNH